MYSEPKRQIFQEFEAAQAEGALPLFACCVGPLYALHRVDVEDERAGLGEYHFNVPSTDHLWPDHVPGGVIDQAGTTVVLEDTLLRYYEGSSNAELTEDAGNKVLSSLVFVTNDAAARTEAAFGDRDVEVGDWVRLTWLPSECDSSSDSSDGSGGATQEVFTQVAGFLPDVVPGSSVPVDDPFRESGFPYTSLSVAATVVPSTTEPTKYTLAYVATDYNGLVDGFPRDVYTVQVLQVGTGAPGGLGGTKLRITSEGNDTPLTLQLGTDIVYDGGMGWYEIPLGNRGALMHLSDSGGGSVLINDSWQVEVSQDYTQVDVASTAEFEATANTNYDGDKNTKYIITVIEGGTLDPASVTAGDVRIQFRTNNGADTQGFLTIPAADFSVATSVAYPIGLRNIELVFKKGSQYNTGGVFSFSMLAQTEGAIHTLVLQDPIDHIAACSMNMDLLIRTTVDFPETHYTLTQDTITIDGNASVLSDLLGTPELMSVFGGFLFVDYRELRTDVCNDVGFVETTVGRDEALGPNSPLNPLSKAVAHAQEEAAFTIGVFYVAICSDDLTGYREALAVLTEQDAPYGLVLLSNDEDVKQELKDHVLDRSSPINGQWRNGWVANNEPQVVSVVTELSNGDDIEGTVDLFPVGTYREVNAAGALFQTRGVEPGDKLRINFSTDIDGNVTYDEFTVDRVNTETQIILVEDLGAPIAVAVKLEIWRDQDNAEYAQALSDHAERYDTRRINCVYADNPVELDGTAMELFYVAAALAGQRAAIPPHAPQSQLDLVSIFMDPLQSFSRTNLNTIASGGVWVVNKDFSGRIFTRHQLTSVNDFGNFIEREFSKTSNLDHISRDFLIQTADLFGQANISDDSMNLINQRVSTTIELITNRTYSAKIGAQMLGATILRLERHPVLRDTVEVEIDPALPDPLNNLPIIFRVS